MRRSGGGGRYRASIASYLLAGFLGLSLTPATSFTRGSSAQAPEPPRVPGESPAYEFRSGLWFDGDAFRAGSFYTQHGVLTHRRPARVDSVVDLRGRWVVPPLAEAHNHNVEASDRLDDLVRRYLESGVFYVKNPNVLPSSALSIRDRVNRPTSIDVTFAMGGFTSPGGHPIGVVQRAVAGGLWTEDEGDGAFYHAIRDEDDLDRRWAGFLALGPDFVKTYLLYSENHAAIRDDPAHEGRRGLDPALLPEIVRRAHGAGLRVSTHVETAVDFHHAVAAGVDEIAHLPGFRGDRDNRFPDPDVFLIRESDARRAGERGIVVVTTLANLEGSEPDSVVEAARAVWTLNLSLLKKHGVPLAVGSDAYDGVGIAEAFQLRELGVLSTAELLGAWVRTTPSTIFPHRRVGRLEEGFEASFLVLDRDPLVDLSAVRDIGFAVKRGLILDPASRAGEGAGPEGPP